MTDKTNVRPNYKGSADGYLRMLTDASAEVELSILPSDTLWGVLVGWDRYVLFLQSDGIPLMVSKGAIRFIRPTGKAGRVDGPV